MGRKSQGDVERELKEATAPFVFRLRQIFADYDGPVAGLGSIGGDARLGGFVLGVSVGLIGDDLSREEVHALVDNVFNEEERRKVPENRPS